MTERERLLAVFNGQKPDVTPWYADLSYWHDGQKRMGKLPKKYEGEEGYLKLHQDTGAGIYLYVPPVWKQEFDETVKTSERTEGNKTIAVLSTPLGQLQTVQEYIPHSFSTAFTEHFIKTPADLKIMRYIFSHRRITSSFEEFKRIDSLWGESGLPCATPPCSVSPLQTLLARWAGVETTVTLLMDAREELERTITELEENDDEIFRIIAESPVELVVFPENLSGEVTGRNLMQKYEIPYWQKRIKELHKTGKLVLLHNDGTLKASLPLLVETDLDGVEAVTPAPVGDLTLEEIKEIAGDKTIIWGCLPGALFSPVYSEDYFKNHVKEVLQTFPLGSKFVLGVADQVPPDTEFSRICSVRKVLEDSTR